MEEGVRVKCGQWIPAKLTFLRYTWGPSKKGAVPRKGNEYLALCEKLHAVDYTVKVKGWSVNTNHANSHTRQRRTAILTATILVDLSCALRRAQKEHTAGKGTVKLFPGTKQRCDPPVARSYSHSVRDAYRRRRTGRPSWR